MAWRKLIPGRETNKDNSPEAGGVWNVGETVGKPVGGKRNEPGREEKDIMCKMSDMCLVLLIPSIDWYGL